MEQRLSLVTLGVGDLARARAFYENLGWKASKISGEEVVFFQVGPIVFSLFARVDLAADAGVESTGSGFRGIALAHNVRSHEAVDATLAEAVAAGGTLIKAAKEAEWGGYSGYFADPDGHLWEIAHNPGFTLGPDGGCRLPD